MSAADLKRPKIMISAGESSGEIHGAALIQAARGKGLDWSFLGLGGDRMAEAGARLLGHINDTAVMGLTEVVGSLSRILKIRSSLARALEIEKPQVLVLIDAPDFNFALARRATALGIPVVYYICPQVWAWREGRLNFLKKNTSRRALLFEFERRFYEERGLSADWVGHPVLDELPPPLNRDEAKLALGLNPKKRLLTILPGSRRKVVERLAPLLLATADKMLDRDADLQIFLPRADSIEPAFLDSFISQAGWRLKERLRVEPAKPQSGPRAGSGEGGCHSKSHLAMAAADLAIVASGTSSVEAAFLGTPQIVVYKVSGLSWFLGKKLVSAPFVTIANLVAGREVVPELLQDQANVDKLIKTAWPILNGGVARAKMVEDLARVKRDLGQPGASGRVVDIIAEELARLQAGHPAHEEAVVKKGPVTPGEGLKNRLTLKIPRAGDDC